MYLFSPGFLAMYFEKSSHISCLESCFHTPHLAGSSYNNPGRSAALVVAPHQPIWTELKLIELTWNVWLFADPEGKSRSSRPLSWLLAGNLLLLLLKHCYVFIIPSCLPFPSFPPSPSLPLLPLQFFKLKVSVGPLPPWPRRQALTCQHLLYTSPLRWAHHTLPFSGFILGSFQSPFLCSSHLSFIYLILCVLIMDRKPGLMLGAALKDLTVQRLFEWTNHCLFIMN